MTRYIAIQEVTFAFYSHWSKALPKVTHRMFQGCHSLSMGRGVKEGDDGPGVDTDFILYVSANATRSCGPKTIAYAVHCQQELALDR